MASDEDRALGVVRVRRPKECDDGDRVDIVHGRERHADMYGRRNVEPGRGRSRIAATCAHEVLRHGHGLAGGGEKLVRDVLADDEGGEDLGLEPRDVRVTEGPAAHDEHTDRALLIGVLNRAAPVRRGGAGGESDLPPRGRAGGVVLPAAPRRATDRRDLRLYFSPARTPAPALAAIDAPPRSVPAP